MISGNWPLQLFGLADELPLHSSFGNSKSKKRIRLSNQIKENGRLSRAA
jgi:hypothetical protein